MHEIYGPVRDLLRSKTLLKAEIATLRASSFAVSLCENALLKSEASDVYLALWLISGMDPNAETMHTLHYTAAVIQSTRIRLGMSFDDISGEISKIPTAAARNFLMECMARNDDPDHVLAAFGLALIRDEKGRRFKQKIQEISGQVEICF